MRSLYGKLQPGVWPVFAFLLVVVLPWGWWSAAAGAQEPPLATPSEQGGVRNPFGHDQETKQDPMLRHALEEAAKKRNVERQARLVADTGKLLQLAQELKVEVDKSDKNMLSITVVKKAEEIERLAKGVKERMRSE